MPRVRRIMVSARFVDGHFKMFIEHPLIRRARMMCQFLGDSLLCVEHVVSAKDYSAISADMELPLQCLTQLHQRIATTDGHGN